MSDFCRSRKKIKNPTYGWASATVRGTNRTTFYFSICLMPCKSLRKRCTDCTKISAVERGASVQILNAVLELTNLQPKSFPTFETSPSSVSGDENNNFILRMRFSFVHTACNYHHTSINAKHCPTPGLEMSGKWPAQHVAVKYFYFERCAPVISNSGCL